MYNDAPMKELELQNRGDLVWVEYTVTFESGPALSGKSDVSFRYTGTQWEEYQEDF